MSFNLEWKYTIPTSDIIKDVIPGIATKDMEEYIQKIGNVWEVFGVTMDSFTWNIMRNHEQIRHFLQEYNAKFNTKLTIQTFKITGIQQICNNQHARQWIPFKQFMQTKDVERGKLASFQLLKKSGGRYNDFCCRLPWQWRPRNFIVTSAGVMYYSQPTKEIKEYMPFNKKSFNISCGTEQTGFQYGIKLQANHRKLLLYANDGCTFFRFVYIVKEALRHLMGPEKNPFGSFAPPRSIQNVRFLIDGQKYFEAAHDAIQKATWQIMICGWWVSPQVYLKRPVTKYSQSRLDRVLLRAAQRQVKIFILLYNQSSFLTNDSSYTKQTLQALSPQIKVLQHPLGILPTFWSHHEKAVIIDQNLVLMGGVDLCFGRFDTSQHTIVKNDTALYPGIDYNNIRINQFNRVREFWIDGVERNKPRLPWHDVGVTFQGQAVQDICLHFIQYWNYASFQTHYEGRYVLILDKDRQKQPLIRRIKQGIQNKFEKLKNFAGELKDRVLHKQNQHEQQQKVQSSKMQEPVKSDQINLVLVEKSDIEQDLQSHKRMVSKIEGSASSDDYKFMPKAKEGLGNQFRQRMLAYQDNKNTKGTQLKSIIQLDQIVEQMGDKIEKIDYINDIRLTNKSKVSLAPQQQFQCQVLRSVGTWSIGCNPNQKQTSIHQAYLHLIQNAQNFIYIQNQFFVSKVEGVGTVKNQIAHTLYKRVKKAYQRKQNFKIYIIIPLVPGFAGQLDDPDAVLPRILLHWQYNTICRSEMSLFQRLQTQGINPHNYISFFGLRTHGIFQGKPTTEIVYPHSKVMIVDDRQLIIGSANINDRSMRGSRDSQLCLLLQGKMLERVLVGDRTEEISPKIRNLRTTLWKEHFGPDINFDDPSSNSLFKAIKKRANINTQILRDIFHCYPDEKVTTLKQMQRWRSKQPQVELYQQINKDIKGFVVQFPLNFLKDEDLTTGSSLYPDSLSV